MPAVSRVARKWDIDFYIYMTIDLFLFFFLLHFLPLFRSFSVSLINPSTRVGIVYLSPLFLQPLFLSSFPSFHCFICVSACDCLLHSEN
jgi:hypothetical protein